jgi:hypothetical protein
MPPPLLPDCVCIPRISHRPSFCWRAGRLDGDTASVLEGARVGVTLQEVLSRFPTVLPVVQEAVACLAYLAAPGTTRLLSLDPLPLVAAACKRFLKTGSVRCCFFLLSARRLCHLCVTLLE